MDARVELAPLERVQSQLGVARVVLDQEDLGRRKAHAGCAPSVK
jgi:hypothetical protein